MILRLIISTLLGFLLVVAALAILAAPLWFGYCALVRRSVGWKNFAAKFPVDHAHGAGTRFSAMNGYFDHQGGPAKLRYMFRIEIAREGFLIVPYFARRLPVLIPWDAIARVDEISLSSRVGLTVNDGEDKTFSFWIPGKALAVIGQCIPAERLHQTSLFQLVSDHTKIQG